MIEPYFETDNGKLYHGGCLGLLKQMPDESVDCVVTSPPYWGLRDYSTAGQIGLEPTIQEYINVMAEIFSEVKRVSKDDGTLWLNMGDSYAAVGISGLGTTGGHGKFRGGAKADNRIRERSIPQGLKPKDLIGMPWRIAFALQADGWYLRSDIIWHKPNPMPESVTDRPTKAHEYIFLMTKSSKYFYDAEAIKEKVTGNSHEWGNGVNPKAKMAFPEGCARGEVPHNSADHYKNMQREKPHSIHEARIKQNPSFSSAVSKPVDNRNKRTVWTIPTQGYSEAHFATYPVNLIYPCIKAGCRPEGIVLDPFIGSGTTAIVAERLNRPWVGIEINQEYCDIAVDRIKKETAQYKLELT